MRPPGDVISLAGFREAPPELDPETAWNLAGEQLRQVDPQRFEKLLQVARGIIEVHRNPIGRDQ